MVVTLIVAVFVFFLLLKVIKTTIHHALIAAAILVLLYTCFGITPQDIWYQLTHLHANSIQASQTSVSK